MASTFFCAGFGVAGRRAEVVRAKSEAEAGAGDGGVAIVFSPSSYLLRGSQLLLASEVSPLGLYHARHW